jgi:dTDP-glucose 4,6-dehydratase
MKNIDLIKTICRLLDEIKGGSHGDLIEFIADRPGHDFRYSMESSKIRNDLGWKPEFTFEDALRRTVLWYINNTEWLESCINGEYRNYYDRNYSNR